MILSVTVTVGCFERKLRSVTDSYIMYTWIQVVDTQ